jgi:phenylacetic acid degradation operon negative regulatory protein
MLRHLNREGFISSKDREGGSSWIITAAGLEKLKSLKSKSKDLKSYLDYKKERVDKLVIVAFDIPERLRYHRAWLRDALKFLGFNLFQKSVWMGNVAIPEDFISDLKRKGIAGYVDIFEAGSKGTLNRLA